MKNQFVYIFLIFAGSLINSCGPDTATPELEMPFTGELTGRWYPGKSIIKGNPYPYEGHEECAKNYIEFGNKGEYREVTILNCQEIMNRLATFIIVGPQLYIQYSPTMSKELFIKKLTSTHLELISTDDYFGDGILQEVITYYSKE